MSRQSIAELASPGEQAPVRGGALVPASPSPAVRKELHTDIRSWANRLPVSPKAMVGGGTLVAGAGVLLAALGSIGFLGVIVAGSMFTAGGGIAFLGILKWLDRGQPVGEAPRPLPARDPNVLRERARRVAGALARGEATFERLLAQLRWTEQALVEALVYMKEAGLVVEDLDLDSGEWVYRLHDHEATGTPASLTLADRQSRT